jgi:hypothetical protein
MSYDIKIPAIDKEHQVPSNQPPWKDQAISIVKKYKGLYGKQFQDASNLTGIPVWMLVGFASVEGMGAKNETLTNATPSIMQMNPSTAWQTMKDQLDKTSVTIGDFYNLYSMLPTIFVVKRTIPKNFWDKSNINIRQNSAQSYLDLKPELTSIPLIRAKMLSDVYFAILLGGTHLAQLGAKSIKESGKFRLDHIIIKYNAGTGRFKSAVTNKNLITADTTTLVNQLNIPVTEAYIIKLMGKNGFLDVQKQGKA